jgi:penicillin-binding protein 1A
VTLAKAAGVKRSRLDAVPSLALGTSPVTLLEMVSSYGTIARGGQYREPVFVRSIKDREGRVLAEFSKAPVRVMSERTATELIDMMRGVVSRGTGTAIKSQFQITADIACKTGTTQNNTDGWFILMHPELVVGSWVGFNDARVTMRSDYWGQGGHSALLLVGDFFRAATSQNMINVKATFPRPERPALMAAAAPPATMDDQGDVVTSAAPMPRPTGSADIVVRRYVGGGAWAGDSHAAAMADAAPARSAEEVGAILGGMGRDPVTGARMAARSAVDYGNDHPVAASGASGGGETGSGADSEPPR